MAESFADRSHVHSVIYQLGRVSVSEHVEGDDRYRAELANLIHEPPIERQRRRLRA